MWVAYVQRRQVEEEMLFYEQQWAIEQCLEEDATESRTREEGLKKHGYR